MSGISSGSLQPTYHGHVATARDALKLFEACLRGQLSHVPRRPHERERNSLIKSGSIFIYEENASGIKRWTDGVPWSPSRILGNFLVYRELSKPFPPGEKKRAQKRPKNNNRAARMSDPYPTQRRTSGGEDAPTAAYPESATQTTVGESRESERSLIGSLVDSYGFKEGGLVKKTMSVNVNGTHHHMVSYYSLDDVIDGNLISPTKDKDLDDVEPRPDLIARQNFRAPLDDNETQQDALAAMHGNFQGYGDSFGPNRSGMMGYMGQPPHNPHNSHNAHFAMGMYSGPPYTSTIIAPPAYSTAPITQSYFPPTTISGSFPPPYPATSLAPLPIIETHPATHGYPYSGHRQSYPPTNHVTTRIGSLESITPTSDSRGSDTDWHRQGQNSSYSASPISAQSAYGSSAAPINQWNIPPSNPRDDAWNSYAVRTGVPPKNAESHSSGHPSESTDEEGEEESQG